MPTSTFRGRKEAFGLANSLNQAAVEFSCKTACKEKDKARAKVGWDLAGIWRKLGQLNRQNSSKVGK